MTFDYSKYENEFIKYFKNLDGYKGLSEEEIFNIIFHSVVCMCELICDREFILHE